MKKLKKLLNLIELSPAIAVIMAVILGLQLTTPVLNDVVWPEKPEITVEAKEKKDSKPEEKKEEAEAGVGDYEDGVHEGVGVGYGGQVKVSVTVEKKQISAVDIVSHNDTETFFSKAQSAIIPAILTQQTWEVDSVSGATYSSRGIKEAVCNALTGQVSTSDEPEKVEPTASLQNDKFVLGTFKDGTYQGSASGFGGTIKVSVTIKDGKITAIKVLSHSGETSSYYNKATAIISRILKAQSPNVDTVSGATYSSSGIREAVKAALKKATGKKSTKTVTQTKQETKKTEEVKVPDGMPADGTYTGKAHCEQSGRFSYDVTITATYKDGALVSVSMSTTDDGSNKTYISRAWTGLQTELLSHIKGDVDAVSRATYTSDAIRNAYKAAYKQAVEANGGKVEDSTEDEKTDESDEDITEDKSEDTDKADESDQTSSGSSSEEDLTGRPADGSYAVSVLVDSTQTSQSKYAGWFSNYTLSASVTFSDGKLTAISDLVVGNDADDYEYDDDEYYTTQAGKTVVANLIKAQSADVDVCTGATCSSNAIIEVYKAGLRAAIQAYKDQNAGEDSENVEAEVSATASKDEKSLSDSSDSVKTASLDEEATTEDSASSQEDGDKQVKKEDMSSGEEADSDASEKEKADEESDKDKKSEESDKDKESEDSDKDKESEDSDKDKDSDKDSEESENLDKSEDSEK